MEQLDLALLREWLAELYDQGLERGERAAEAGGGAGDVQVSAGRKDRARKNLAARLRTPKAKQRLPEVMSAEKTNNLLDAVERGEGLERPSSERDIAFLELLYGCGIRVSELVGINLEDHRSAGRLAAGARQGE